MAMSEDIGAFFNAADFGVTATFGAESGQVILDKPDVEIMAGRIQDTQYLMHYPSTLFASLAQGSSVTVDGAAYEVREISAMDDGKIKQAILEAA